MKSTFCSLRVGEADILFPKATDRGDFEKSFECTVVTGATFAIVRAPKADDKASLAFARFEELRKAMHRRSLA